MATTESRTGFRLPWSSEERSDKATNGRTAEAGATDEATDAVTEATATAPASTETTDDAPAVGQATDESSASSEDQVGEAGQPIESSDTDPAHRIRYEPEGSFRGVDAIPRPRRPG